MSAADADRLSSRAPVGASGDLLRRPAVARLGVILLLLAAWELYGRFVADPLFVAPASRSLLAVGEILRDPKVAAAILVALFEIVVAFLLSVMIGLAVGVAIGVRRFTRGALYPILLMLYAIPQSTILPLFILGFGIDAASKVAYGVSHGLFPIAIAVVAGIRKIEPIYFRAAHSLGASRWQVVREIVVPFIVRSLFAGMRLGMSAVVIGVLLAELYVSSAGIGFYTRLFADSFEPAKLLAVIIILAAIAVTLNEVCRIAETRYTRWMGPR